MNKLKMMPTLAVAVGIAFGAASLSPLRADPIVIPSPTEDNAAAVIALTNALATAAVGTTITLSRGVYDLSGVVSDSADGGGHLLIDKFLILRGDPDCDREEVVLRGGGSTRICRLKQKNLGPGKSPVFENMTFTNGCSTSWGGAIGYGTGNIGNCAYVTNCVFRGCVAGSGAGAVRGATLSNCLLENNICTNGNGGAAARVLAYDCVFSNNVNSAGNGGALNQASAYDSLFVSNRCDVSKRDGGAISSCFLIHGCTFIGNYSEHYGAAASGDSNDGVTVSNCTFVGNNANEGGVLYFPGKNEVNVLDSRFYNNWASGSLAGAVEGNGNTRVYECVFTNNASASGVGVGKGVTIWSNCTFIANSVRPYDDASGRTACILGASTNYFTCVARNCTFRDHFSTTTAYRQDPTLPCERAYRMRADACAAYMTLVDCTIEGTFYNCVAERCVVTNAPSKTKAVVCGASVLTNCLVAANHLDGASTGIFASLNDFADAPQIVNCTVVDNSYGSDKFMFSGTTNSVAVNTLFYGNKRGEDGCDVICDQTDGLAMVNCLYQYKKTTDTGSSISVDENPVVLAAGKTPKFNAGRNSEFPYYMPEANSLAANAGASLGYTEADIDLGGYSRLRDGKVDIGAYSCYMPSPGFIIMFR